MFKVYFLLALAFLGWAYWRFTSGDIENGLWLAAGAILIAIFGIASLIVKTRDTFLDTLEPTQDQHTETEVDR